MVTLLDDIISAAHLEESIPDPIADKGLLLSGIITLSLTNWSEIDSDSGKFPVWFPVLVISRDAILLVGTVVLYLLNGKVHVKPHWTGKIATVLQMVAIGWVMLQLGVIPLLYVVFAAGAFTLVSGIILRCRRRASVAGRRPRPSDETLDVG